MQVKAKSGKAFIQGFYIDSDAEEVKAISASDGSNDRIDRIVLQVDGVNNDITLDVLTGTPAATPAAPSLTQSSSVWEISLAQVLIAQSVVTVNPADVTKEATFSYPYIPDNLGGHNKIINSNLDFWQRGISFAAIATTQLFADRWKYTKVGAMVHTASQEADVPTLEEAGFQSTYSFKIDCTTIDGTIAAGDFCILLNTMEGFDYAPLKGKEVTLSFWVKATKIGIYCVAFRNGGLDRSYVVEYEIFTTGTWEKKTITLTLDQTGGTEDYISGSGLLLTWTLAVGDTFETTADEWQTGNYLGTNSQVNACDNTANDFQLAQVKLELGNSATRFCRAGNSIGDEEELVKKYFERLFPNFNNGQYSTGFATTETLSYSTLHFSEKRVAPTITFSAVDDFVVQHVASARIASTVMGAALISPKAARLDVTVAAGLNPGEGNIIQGKASTSHYIDLNSEL